jgi:methyl-accepting chemotaxis protein
VTIVFTTTGISTSPPFFTDFISRFGYYDLFLVDNDGTVLYTVFKELDFATNLRHGPYANSGLARAFNNAKKATVGKYVLDNFSAYLPSYDGPASFAATPIFHDGKRVGVLILQMPIDAINAITTNKRKWKEVGLGESGETYLVGPDMKARSNQSFSCREQI